MVAQGTGSLSYQWRHNGILLPGATASNLVVANVQPSQTGSYTVVVTDQLGVTTNQPAAILEVRPQILTQPQSQSAALGETVQFSVSAAGNEPLRYRWRRNGQLLPGAQGTTLTLENVQPADAGTYQAIVSHVNPSGIAGNVSGNAVLIVK